MSEKIDSRVVVMDFDNDKFQSGTAESISSLEELKRSLNLTGASKGLEGINTAIKGVDINPLAKAVDTVAVSFSSLQIIATTALANITNSAINAGKSMLRSLVKPLTEGGKTRALNIEQAKFQFKGLGMDIEATMADANYAVSDTAYSLDAAAKVAAQLGASGMRAGDEMKKALRGVSGVAAMTSSTYEDIGNVFTKVAGQGRLMGDDLLRLSSRGINAAATIAKHFGKTEQEIREMVTKGKIDFKMFTDAMDSAFGEHAKSANETFTGSLANMKAALSRIGQRFYTPLHANLITPFNTLKTVFQQVNKALDPLFPALTKVMEIMSSSSVTFMKALDFTGLANTVAIVSKQIETFAVKIGELVEKIKMGGEGTKNFTRTLKGFFALIDIGRMALTAVVTGMISLTKTLFPATNNFLSVTASIGDFIVAIRDALKASDSFNVFFSKILIILKPIANAIVKITGLIANAFESISSPDLSGIEELTDKVEERVQPLIKLGEGIKTFLGFFYNLASTIGSIFKQLTTSIMTALGASNFDALFDFINSGLIAAILYSTKKFIDSMTTMTNSVKGIVGIFDDVRGVLAAYQSQLKANILLKIASAVGILAAALLTISLIDSEKLTASLGAMTTMMIELFGALAAMNALSGATSAKGFFGGFLGLLSVTTGVIALSVALLLLAVAMKQLADLDWKNVATGLTTIAGLTAILIAATKILETSSKSLIVASVGFVIFGAAMLVLVKAVRQLGEIDLDKLRNGLIGIGVLIAELVIFMKVTDLSGMGALKGAGLVLLAGAILVLTVAVKQLSEIDSKKLATSILGLTGMMAALAIFIKVTGESKHVVASAVSLTILAVAMNALAFAITKMSDIPWDKLKTGLVAFGVTLGAITLALIALPPGVFLKSLALLDVAGAMMILAQALKALAAMTWDEIQRGLTSLVVSLGAIIGAFFLLSKTSSITDSLAFVVLTTSILILANALKILGGMSLQQIGTALLALAGAFVIVGVAATILSPAIPAIMGLAIAISLLGIGVAAIGGGILALSTGLAALAVAGTAGTVALVAFLTALIGMIPHAAKTLAEGVIEFITVIGSSAPAVAQAVKSLVLAIVDTLVTLIPVVVDAGLKLITQFLDAMVEYMPHILEAGGEVVVIFLKGIAANIQDVVEAGVDIVINIIKGIVKKLGDIIQAGFDLMIAFINGMAKAVRENGAAVTDAVLNLIQAIIETAVGALFKSIERFEDIGEDIVMGLLQGIKNKISEIVTGVTNLAQSAIDAAREVLRSDSPSKEFEDIGEDVGAGLAIGIENSTPKVEAASKEMTLAAIKEAEEAARKTAKTAEEASRAAYNAAIGWMDDRAYYSTLTLYEELDAWEYVQTKYIEGTEERKKADREVFRIRQNLHTAEKSFAQDLVDVTRYATQKKIEYEEDYYDKCKQINDKLENDIKSLNDQYDDALKSRSKALYDSYGLFDKVEPKAPTSGTDLIKNLQDQIAEFNDWTVALSDLSSKGVESELIEELEKMGPKSLSELNALNSLTQSELGEYVTLWQTKTEIAKKQASKELEGLRKDVHSQIRQLNIQAEIDLEEQRSIFEERTTQLAKETALIIDQMKKDWLKKIGELRTEGEKDFTRFADNIVTIMGTPDWAGVGRGIVDGMTTGIRSEASRLADEAARVALEALEAAKDALGVESPSKKFAELGKFSVMGLAQGLKKFAARAAFSAEQVGEGAMDAVRKSLSGISDIFDGINTEPVIRPVIDLSDIEAGSLMIDELLSRAQGLNISKVKRNVPILSQAEQSKSTSNDIPSKETKVTFTQNNYSPKALSRLEIYRQTKNQLTTLKGVVNTV